MSLSGFGGVLAFARRAIVEQHRWMSPEEFNETFALLPFSCPVRTSSTSRWCSDRAFAELPAGLAAFTGLIVRPWSSSRPGRALPRISARSKHSGGFWPPRGLCAGRGRASDGGGLADLMMPLFEKRDYIGAGADGRGIRQRSGFSGCRSGACCWWRSRSVSADQLCAIARPGPQRQAQAMNPRRQTRFRPWVWTFAVMSLFAVGGGNSDHSRNAPGRGRRPALDDRQAIRRHLCDLAALARTERADRHPDRLFRRGPWPAGWPATLAMCGPDLRRGWPIVVSRLLTRQWRHCGLARDHCLKGRPGAACRPPG